MSSLKSFICVSSFKSYLLLMHIHDHPHYDRKTNSNLVYSHTNANEMALVCKDSQLKTTTVTMKSDYSYRTSTNPQDNKL